MDLLHPRSPAALATAIVCLAATAEAQQPRGNVVGPRASAAAATQQAASPAPDSGWSRWVRFDGGTVAARYRYLQDSYGDRTASQLQLREALRARVRFDSGDRINLSIGAGSGSSFVSSWNSTGIGTGDTAWPFQVRHLSLAARPVQGIEIQAGSVEFARGDTTEVIGYDSDGYVAGERVVVRRPDRLPLNDVVLTVGFVGDFLQPNFFHRSGRLGDWNYVQFLARRSLGEAASLTGEFEQLDGEEIVRVAVVARTAVTRIADSLTFEAYGRSALSGGGIHLSGQKRLGAVTLRAGLAQIDEATGRLNADRFGAGRRGYLHVSVDVYRNLVLQVWAGRALGRTEDLRTRTRIDVIAEYDVLGALRSVTGR